MLLHCSVATERSSCREARKKSRYDPQKGFHPSRASKHAAGLPLKKVLFSSLYAGSDLVDMRVFVHQEQLTRVSLSGKDEPVAGTTKAIMYGEIRAALERRGDELPAADAWRIPSSNVRVP